VETIMSTSASALDTIRVLIVEDHLVLSEALSLRIEAEPDMTVVGVTGSVAELASLVTIRRPNVVVLDVGLEDGSGIDEIETVRSLGDGPSIVVLSSRSDNPTVVSALRLGAAGYVSKTAPIDELFNAMRAALSGGTWISPSVATQLLPALIDAHLDSDDSLNVLTAREREVLELMVNGLPNADIARSMGLSINTIRTHVYNLQRKLGVHSKLAAIAVARQAGIHPT
jgi:DNA-binding NarL/FixJ family response regulator